jgi:hypothetical protein
MTAFKTPRLAIRTGLYTALNGVISYNSTTLPVYDSAAIPENAIKPYILLGSQTDTPNHSKDNFGFDSTVQVEAVTSSFGNNQAGEKAANTISQSIQAVLMPDRTTLGFSVSGFNVYTMELDSVRVIQILSGAEWIVREISIFRIKTFQN